MGTLKLDYINTESSNPDCLIQDFSSKTDQIWILKHNCWENMIKLLINMI